MKLIVKYNRDKDIECWQRLVNAEGMFGRVFPDKIILSDERIILAKNKIKEFQVIYDNLSGFDDGIKIIYGNHPPNFLPCYINTSGFSMDSYPDYISISASCNNEIKISTMLVHEMSHFMFRAYYSDFCYSIGCSDDDIEEIKEIVTVINNSVFKGVEDKGYEVHFLFREKVSGAWKDGLNLKQIIILIMDLGLESLTKK